LTNDIDLGTGLDSTTDNDIKTNGWKSLGTEAAPITGTLDGNGFFLYDIWSNRPNDSNSGGFIARAKDLTIKNLGIKTKDGKSLKGKDNVGGFVCYFDNVQIENCCFNGMVRGGKQLGAFFGQTDVAGSSIKNSYAYGGVYGTDNVGGLWGKTTKDHSSIENSYAMVTVNGQGGQGSAAGIIGSADMAGAVATDIVMTVKNSLVLNDTISGAWAVAPVCAYNRNAANVKVINSVQLSSTIIQGRTMGSSVNATYIRSRQQILGADSVYVNRNWDLNDTWQIGNDQYPAPVLKNLTKTYQPAGVPRHLTSGTRNVTENNLIVYPNPTSGRLFVKTDTPVTIFVYNNMGSLLQTTVTDAELDISAYPAGFYLLKIKGQDQYIKVIKTEN
jgi:hypothetical protein